LTIDFSDRRFRVWDHLASLYRLQSQGQSYAIVAVACYVFTNTRDAFESPLAQGVQLSFDEWGEKLLFTLK